MMTEAHMRVRMKNAFGKAGVHTTPIETWIGKGIPDVNWCIDGKEFWTELKVLTTSNRLREALKPEQVAWLLGRTNAGGNAWVVGQHVKTKCFFAWWGGKARELSNSGADACAIADYAFEQRDLKNLGSALRAGKPKL